MKKKKVVKMEKMIEKTRKNKWMKIIWRKNWKEMKNWSVKLKKIYEWKISIKREGEKINEERKALQEKKWRRNKQNGGKNKKEN